MTESKTHKELIDYMQQYCKTRFPRATVSIKRRMKEYSDPPQGGILPDLLLTTEHGVSVATECIAYTWKPLYDKILTLAKKADIIVIALPSNLKIPDKILKIINANNRIHIHRVADIQIECPICIEGGKEK